MRFPAGLATAVKHKGVPRLLGAQVPADFADWLDFVAVGALLAFTWEAGPAAFAWLAVALGLPYVVIGPLAGALIDRADLRRVLVLSNLGRAAGTFCLAFAPDVIVLLVIVFARGAADAFFTPAKQAAIQALVPPEERTAANGLSHAINQTSKVAGPAIGGALLVFLTPQAVFLANALVSLAAALMLLGLDLRQRAAATPAQSRSLLHEMREGLAEFRHKPALTLGLLLMAFGYFFLFLYDTLIPLLTKTLLYDQSVFGLAIAAAGGGGVLASLAVGAWLGRVNAFALMGFGYLVSGPLAVLLGLAPAAQSPPPCWLYVGVFGLLGAATAVVVVPFRTIVQQQAVPERMARVSAVCEAVTVSVMLVAPFAGAAVATAYSIGASFIAGGAALIALSAAAFLTALRLAP